VENIRVARAVVEIDAFPASQVSRFNSRIAYRCVSEAFERYPYAPYYLCLLHQDTPLNMSTTSVTTTNIPKLTHDPSIYAGWRTASEVALQLADSWNAALGLDAEPNRARWINRARGATGTVLARNARAGSAMPEASETTSGNAMTADEREEWEKWQTRESKAQGMLKASVSLAIKLDLDDLKSAGDMWTHCEHLHAATLLRTNERFEGNSTHWISKMTQRLRRWRPTWSCSLSRTQWGMHRSRPARAALIYLCRLLNAA
jgi:hypothetical protein